ncbi:hypothetical protein KJ603_00895 [Patescibacteria group bacterium]|nr:hypothetical protein [Patescibacteria group bacterium]
MTLNHYEKITAFLIFLKNHPEIQEGSKEYKQAMDEFVPRQAYSEK